MKKFKKLIPALCMLLVSALFVGTSTYAWFSMNTSVTATNMEVKAVADNPYLQISKESAAAGFSTEVALEMKATDALKLITPLNLKDKIAANAYFDTNGTTEGTEVAKATKPSELIWGYATSNKTSESQGTNKTTKMEAAKAVEYYMIDEMWLKVADEGANGYNLKATCVADATTTNTIADSVRVLLMTDDGRYVVFKVKGGTVVDGNAVLADTLIAKKGTTTAGTVVKVTAYMYFDGTDNVAYTDIATDLSAVKTSLSYTIDTVAPAAP